MSIFDVAFNLAWLVPLFPFLAFAAILLFTYRNHRLSHQLAIGGIAVSTVLAQIVFWTAVLMPVGGGERAFESARVPWLPLGLEVFSLGVYVDPATAIMLFMVPLVCLMIFIYSVGYMHGDPRYSRFFAYISLFAAGMLGLIVFNNLLAFFLFWEIMGTCSYLLIGFWYEKKSAAQAGLKAFLVTKVGDLFFMLGLALLYAETGSLAYRDVFSPQTLEHLAHTGFLGTQFPAAAVIALLFFGGTVGKSAQFPLHVWLPDAMEGPTPVSALVHAATMVSAGVFLVVRTFPLFAAVEGGLQMTIVAAVGAFTAIFASLIAVAQNDVKRVLAFSTISQLGYMVAALGLGAYAAGAFHLITHAFFKALLFLGSGSVIHAMTWSSLPNLPTWGSLPNLPTWSSLPNLPTCGSLPNLPTWSSLPNLPTWGSLPNLPTCGSLSSPPMWGRLSSLPTWGSLPSLPTWGSLPNLPTWGSLPNLPTWGRLSSLPMSLPNSTPTI